MGVVVHVRRAGLGCSVSGLAATASGRRPGAVCLSDGPSSVLREPQDARSPADMSRWEDLSSQEKTALRKLAKGEVHEVPARMIRRLAALGLADGSPEGRLTLAGLEIYRTRPIGRWK